jgi:hypothetical protein
MDTYINAKDTDYLNGITVCEDARPLGIGERIGRWFEELEEEFRTQRIEFDPMIDFPRDI